MKPWEETWSASNESIYTETGEEIAEVLDDDEDKRAPLMAAAPEMYRVLKLVEWSGNSDDRSCPDCFNRQSFGHARKCRVAAALRKAQGET